MNVPLSYCVSFKVFLIEIGVTFSSAPNGSNTNWTSQEYISKPSVVVAPQVLPRIKKVQGKRKCFGIPIFIQVQILYTY